jgi:glycerol-3-phosphate cytidylyltransferase
MNTGLFWSFQMTASHERIVLTYGTFDLFHPGHVQLLKRARELGSRLVVGLSTDEFNAKKGKKSVMSFEDRQTVLLSCRYVDEVFAEEDWSQKLCDAQRIGADVFVMGDDWLGKFDFMQAACSVVYLPRTQGVSTTAIKSSLHSFPRLPLVQAAAQVF